MHLLPLLQYKAPEMWRGEPYSFSSGARAAADQHLAVLLRLAARVQFQPAPAASAKQDAIFVR